MSKISAYINFKNNCSEAMSFYQACLGGELVITIVKDSPMAAMFPPEAQNTVLHADLTAGDLHLLGSDMQDKSIPEKSVGAVSLLLTCDSKAIMIETFSKLSEGGSATHPPQTFYAGTMGNLIDKFGIKWGVFTYEK